MILSHTPDELAEYTMGQIKAFFPDGRLIDRIKFQGAVRITLERTENCFSHISHPSYYSEQQARFDIFHSDQYCTYLYFLSNSIFQSGEDLTLAKKIFALNKALHAFNCMYDTLLPDIFWLIHVVGTVLGKANYSNFLVVRQNCTVGAMAGAYPTIGKGFVMSAGSSLIGNCQIGANVMLGPGCTIVNRVVEDNTLIALNPGLNSRANSQRALEAHFHNMR